MRVGHQSVVANFFSETWVFRYIHKDKNFYGSIIFLRLREQEITDKISKPPLVKKMLWRKILQIFCAGRQRAQDSSGNT